MRKEAIFITLCISIFFFDANAQTKRMFLNAGIYNPITYLSQKSEYYGADAGNFYSFSPSGGSLSYTENTIYKRLATINSVGGIGFSIANRSSSIFSIEGALCINALQVKTETVDFRWLKLYNSSNQTEASVQDSLNYLPDYDDRSETRYRFIPTVNLKVAMGINLDSRNTIRAAFAYSLPSASNYIESFITGGFSYERRFGRAYAGVEIQKLVATLPDRNYNLKKSFGLIFNMGLSLPQSQKALDREKSKNSPSIL